LGSLPCGRKAVPATFQIQNQSRQPIEIQELLASCRCTKATIDRPVLQGGESATVTVLVDADPTPGLGGATVDVVPRDRAQRGVRLRVSWRNVADLATDPSEVAFGRLAPRSSASRRVRLVRPNEASRAKLLGVTATPPESLTCQTVDDQGAPTSPEAATHLEIKLAANEQAGAGRGILMLSVANADASRVVVPVSWDVHHAVYAIPDRLMLSTQGDGGVVRRTVAVRCDPGQTPEIVAMTMGSTGAACPFQVTSAVDGVATCIVEIPSLIQNDDQIQVTVRTDGEVAIPISVARLSLLSNDK
jgi:hypothetical protein